MSIKTSKRIALGVITALVFAPFAAVAPANAAIGATMNVFNGTAGVVTTSVNAAVGATASVPLTVVFTAGAIGDSVSLTCLTTTRPANAAGVVTTAGDPTTYTYVAGVNSVAPTGAANVATIIGTAAIATSNVVTANYVPNVPGLYVVTCTILSVAGGAGGTAVAGGTLVHTITINAGFSADAANANRAFPIQGTNVTSGFTAITGGQATVRITNLPATTQFFVTTDTGTIISGTPSDAGRVGAVVNTNGTNLAGGFNFTTAAATVSDSMDVRVTDLGAATTTITVRSFNAGTGIATTFVAATVTYGAASAASAQFSTSIIAAGAALGGATDALNVSLVRTIGGQAANIQVTVRDQNGNPLAAGVTASIAGPGLLGLLEGNNRTTAATGRALSRTAAQIGATGTANVTVFADGTAGVATITISSGTVTLATETVTFFGTVATLTATQNYAVARASATGQTLGSTATNLLTVAAATDTRPAVVIVAKDSNGAVVPGLTITGVSSVATVISSAAVAQADGTLLSTGAAGPGTYLASVTSAVGGTSGATATVTFRTPNPAAAGTFISAAPLTFTLGGGVVTETLTFGKATYLPGEAVVVTRTAKDASGNPVFDFAAAPAVSFNKALGGDAIGASFYVGGVRATSATAPTVFAPVTFGEFTARMTSSNTAATVITATASVPAPVAPVAPTVEAPLDKPTLTVVRDGRNIILSGTAVDGEGDIIVYVKGVGTTAWKERAKTLEVAAPGDFNGTIRAPKNNVLIRVKQEGTGLFSNQVVVLK